MKKQLNDKELELIAKHLGNDLTAEESEQFNNWLSESGENRQELENAEKIWAYSDFDDSESYNTDLAWNQMNRRIHHQKVLIPQKEQGRFVSFLKIAASFVLLIGIGYGIFSYVHSTHTNTVIAGNEKILSPVVLPDGSRVFLNAGARLEYPKKFDRSTRQITLSGEAFFEVTRNPQKPFIVKTDKALVKVLGTSFNVLADAGSDSVQVVVETGTVELSSFNTSQKVRLPKGSTGAYYASTHQLSKRSFSDVNAIAWKTNVIVFHDADLKYITKTLSRLFHQQIQLSGEKLNSCRMNSDFKQSSLESILRTIHELLNVSIEKTDKGYIISGPGC